VTAAAGTPPKNSPTSAPLNGARRSMGPRATRFDNAVAEPFFATYQKKPIHTRPWNDLADVKHHTFLWIEAWAQTVVATGLYSSRV